MFGLRTVQYSRFPACITPQRGSTSSVWGVICFLRGHLPDERSAVLAEPR